MSYVPARSSMYASEMYRLLQPFKLNLKQYFNRQNIRTLFNLKSIINVFLNIKTCYKNAPDIKSITHTIIV